MFSRFGFDAPLFLLLLLALQPVPLGVPFVSGCGDRAPLFLPCQSRRVIRDHPGSIGLKERGLCIDRSAATVGKVIGSGMYQFTILQDFM